MTLSHLSRPWLCLVSGACAAALLLAALSFWPASGPWLPDSRLRPECATIDSEKSRGIIFTNPTAARADPALFCACLSEAARRTSSNWLLVAVPLGLLGGFLTLLGGALGPPEGAKPGTFRAERGILLAGTGALLIAAAVYANSRASSASSVAAEAHSALALLNDKKMYVACVHAKSFWMSSRTESAALLLDRFELELTTSAKPEQAENNDH